MTSSNKIQVINYHINKKTFTFVVEVFLLLAPWIHNVLSKTLYIPSQEVSCLSERLVAVATKRKRQTVFPLWKPSFPTLHPSTVQPLLWFGTEKLQKLKSTVCWKTLKMQAAEVRLSIPVRAWSRNICRTNGISSTVMPSIKEKRWDWTSGFTMKTPIPAALPEDMFPKICPNPTTKDKDLSWQKQIFCLTRQTNISSSLKKKGTNGQISRTPWASIKKQKENITSTKRPI